MSSYSQRVNTGQQMTTDYDLSKIFVFENRYQNDGYVNNSNYNPITLLAGTLMGRVTSTNSLVPWRAGAVDGSQRPIGILAQDIINLPSGSNQRASICVAGDVAASQIIFFAGDTLETQDNGRRVKDSIQSDSVGIKLVYSQEMTGSDN